MNDNLRSPSITVFISIQSQSYKASHIEKPSLLLSFKSRRQSPCVSISPSLSSSRLPSPPPLFLLLLRVLLLQLTLLRRVLLTKPVMSLRWMLLTTVAIPCPLFLRLGLLTRPVMLLLPLPTAETLRPLLLRPGLLTKPAMLLTTAATLLLQPTLPLRPALVTFKRLVNIHTYIP